MRSLVVFPTRLVDVRPRFPCGGSSQIPGIPRQGLSAFAFWIRCTAADPIYHVHPTPDIAGTPNTTAHSRTLSAVPLRLHSNDTANPQGSLVSREGTPIDGIPPTAGGTPHPNQPRSLSGPGGPDKATDSSDRTRPHPAFVVTLQAGSYTPPCALPCTCILPRTRCYLALKCK